jgi:hypothetical protein
VDALEVLALLEELEARFPVLDWTLDGLRPWPLFRIDLAFCLDSYLVGSTPPPPVGGWTDRLRTARRLLGAVPHHARTRLSDRDHEAPLEPADVVFLTMSTARRFKRRGRWYCSFSDPILDRLEEAGYRGAVLEFSPGSEYRIPRWRPSLLVQPWLEATRWLRPLDARRGSDVAGQPGFSGLQALVRERTGGAWAPDPGAWARKLGQLQRMAWLFGRWLGRLRPALGLTYGWYDLEGMAFGLACRRRGIPVVDVQHGVQGSGHVAYARWRLPPGGYELLPDLFWTWSEEDAQQLRSWTAGRHRALAVGNLTAEAFLRDPELADSDPPLPARAQEEGALEVLVALSAEQLPELIVSVIRAAPPAWRWWVRVHPAQRHTLGAVEGRLQGRARVEVRRATDAPLYRLLQRVDVVLTELSSSLIEAGLFGKRAVICHPVGAGLYAERVRSGQALVALTAEAVLRALPAAAAAGGERSAAFVPQGLGELVELLGRPGRAGRPSGPV